MMPNENVASASSPLHFLCFLSLQFASHFQPNTLVLVLQYKNALRLMRYGLTKICYLMR